MPSALSQTAIALLLEAPFYGHFLLGLSKAPSTDIPHFDLRFSVDGGARLRYNDAGLARLPEPKRYGKLQHEVLHLALRHPWLAVGYLNRALFGVAADLVVNQYIRPDQLTADALQLHHFAYLEPMFGIVLEREREADYYYRLLDRALKSTCLMSFAEACQCLGGGQGECQVWLDDAMGLGVIDGPHCLDAHEGWRALEHMTAAERRVSENQVRNTLQQSAQRLRRKQLSYGHLPGNLIDLLDDMLREAARVDWRRALKLFAASSSRTFLRNTLRRPSRRYGTVPGTKIQRRTKVLVAVDTSGSVVREELRLFFSEVYHLYRRGADVTVVECDADIQRTYAYRGEPVRFVAGGGGTDFDPPVEVANGPLRPDCLIYFTDGCAPPPSTPCRCPILWLISTEREAIESYTSQLPGRVVHL